MSAKKTTKKVAAKKTAAKKSAAPKKAAKKAAKKAVKKAVKTAAKKAVVIKAAPSIDEIAKAAYLNYRRRMELGLPGDNDSDWLAAERSLSKR